MPRYMLDTDTCSYVMKRSNTAVLRRLQGVPVADVCMSVVTKSELLYGVEVSARRARAVSFVVNPFALGQVGRRADVVTAVRTAEDVDEAG